MSNAVPCRLHLLRLPVRPRVKRRGRRGHGCPRREFKTLGSKNISFSSHADETFADKNAIQKIETVRDIGFDCIHTTRMCFFHKFGLEKIFCSGLTEIRISLTPTDEELYRHIYQNNTGI